MMEFFGALLMILGAAAVFTAALGIVRMPDVFCRMQVSAKASTVGLMGLMLGSALIFGTASAVIWAIMVVVFFSIKNPVGSHALGRACMKAKVPLWEGTYIEEGSEDLASDFQKEGSRPD